MKIVWSVTSVMTRESLSITIIITSSGVNFIKLSLGWLMPGLVSLIPLVSNTSWTQTRTIKGSYLYHNAPQEKGTISRYYSGEDCVGFYLSVDGTVLCLVSRNPSSLVWSQLSIITIVPRPVACNMTQPAPGDLVRTLLAQFLLQ